MSENTRQWDELGALYRMSEGQTLPAGDDLGGRRGRGAALTRSVSDFVEGDVRRFARAQVLWRSFGALALLLGGLALVGGLSAIVRVGTAGLRASNVALWFGALVVAGGLWRLARGRASRYADRLEEQIELRAALEFAEPMRLPQRGAIAIVAAVVAVTLAAAVGGFLLQENPSDSPARILLVTDDAADHDVWLYRTFGLRAEQVTLAEARRRGATDGSLRALADLADAEGSGFVLVDLDALDPGGAGTAAAGENDQGIVGTAGRQAAHTFVALDTGDVAHFANGLAYELAVGRERPWWVRTVRGNTASYGAPEAWIEDPRVRNRVAMTRALFEHRVFQAGPEASDRAENPTLMRGVIFHGLAPDFWARAIQTYEDSAAELAARKLSAAWYGSRSADAPSRRGEPAEGTREPRD